MRGYEAKSARARASIAVRLYKTIKPWPWGHGLGRSFDDCFEMTDGDEVKAELLRRVLTDPELATAMISHGYGEWVAEAMTGGAA